MIRKWPAEHGRELHPKPKFLVTVKAYLSATFGANILRLFDLSLHWVSVVRAIDRNQRSIFDSEKKVSFTIWPCTYLIFFLM
jgi:hypothetical protein